MNRRALLVVLAAAVLALAQWLSPQKADPGKPREQEWHIPTANGSLQMETTVFRPSGEDKHPLVVINHGSPADGSQRASMGRQRYASLSSFFVAHVYVVAVPLRRGYGATGGRWAEGYGSCKNPDYFDAGLATASDIQATIDYMRKQAFVAANHNIVVGQSAGA